MPYLSKVPLSFAIQTPVAIGPIDEYAMVILVWATEVCEKTNVNTAGKLAIRHFNNGFILSLSQLASQLAEIAQTTAQDLHPIGSFDIFGELVFVFARIRHTFAPTGPFRVERLNPRANQMWAGACQRRLHPLTKPSDLLNRPRVPDTASFCDLFEIHFSSRRRRHSRFFLMAAQIIAIVHDEDSEVGRVFIRNRAQDTQIQDEIPIRVERENLTVRQCHC